LIGSTTLVDTHFHIWEAETPSRPRIRATNVRPRSPDPHTAEEMVAIFDSVGVDFGVQVTPNAIVGNDNRYSLESAAKYPGRLSVLGAFDVLTPDPLTWIREWAREPAASGIRIMFFDTPIEADCDSNALRPFWGALEDLGVPVGIYAPGTLCRIISVLKRHPRLQLHVDHLGADFTPGADPFRDVDVLDDLAAFPQVRIKVSGLPSLSRQPYPFRDTHWLIEHVLKKYGAARLMWGSNYPSLFRNHSYEESLSYLEHCTFISSNDRDWILGASAIEAFSIGTRRPEAT
jgi:L-fuconolactonase